MKLRGMIVRLAVAAVVSLGAARAGSVTLRPLPVYGTAEGTEALAWSPDGTLIAAAHWAVAPPDYFITSVVFAYNVASGAPVAIRGLDAIPHGLDPILVMHPTWSPDGRPSTRKAPSESVRVSIGA